MPTKQEEIDELSKELKKVSKINAKLLDDNEALKLSVADLLTENERLRSEGPVGETKRFTRGKLPGEKLIKVEIATGRYEVIEKPEWDSLR